MKTREGLRWITMGILGMFLFYLGKTNYHQRNPAEFVFIILVGVAVLIVALFFLADKQGS